MNEKLSVAAAFVFAYYICTALFMVYWGYAALSKPMPQARPLCGVAEISPDVTSEERTQCREKRGHKL